MAVVAKENVPKTYEAALKAAWIVAGITEADVFYNGFQINEASKREFPELQYGLSIDVPDGIEFDQESKTRVMNGVAALLAHTADDPQRAALSVLVGKIRLMFTTANANRTTWAAAYLPTGYSIDALLITDSPPPYFDDNWAIFEIDFQINCTIP